MLILLRFINFNDQIRSQFCTSHDQMTVQLSGHVQNFGLIDFENLSQDINNFYEISIMSS